MNSTYVPKRRILLPEALDYRLKELAGLNQETSGVLLYRTEGKGDSLDLRVDTAYMTGRGQRHEVEISPDRKRIIDHFISNHPEYRCIEWHTHVTGNTGLSNADRTHYAEELTQDSLYLAMIVTKAKRTTIKGRESGHVQTIVFTTPDDFYERESYLGQELEKFARAMGLQNLPTLKATRKMI